jgi:diguanylate cyclase (GGDEF)-like protein
MVSSDLSPAAFVPDKRGAMARAYGLMVGVGALLATGSLAVDLTPDENHGLVLAMSAAAIPIALIVYFAPPPPARVFGWILAPLTLSFLAFALFLGGDAANPANTLFIPAMVYCFYFFPRPVAYAHLALCSVTTGAALLALAGPAEALDRWMLTIGVAYVTGAVVASLRDRLRRHARADWLTGVANRRGFDERIGAELATGQPFGLLILDVDNFKSLNDAEGHHAGDDALRLVARALIDVAGHENVARWGGDEFVAVLPGADPIGTVLAGDSVRRRLGRHDLAPNISVGTAVAPRNGTDAQSLIRAADAALYAAKRAGRNRVLAASVR